MRGEGVVKLDPYFKGYRADCINDMALEFFDQYDGKKPFFMTISQIEPHHPTPARAKMVLGRLAVLTSSSTATPPLKGPPAITRGT